MSGELICLGAGFAAGLYVGFLLWRVTWIRGKL